VRFSETHDPVRRRGQRKQTQSIEYSDIHEHTGRI
jgi:hypothetical protein